MTKQIHPGSWGLEVNGKGEMEVAGRNTVALAREFQTPLHILNANRLEDTAIQFRTSAESDYPGKVSVHYPFKCNAVPAVVQILHRAGLKAEVMTEFEFELALRLGFKTGEMIVNGPCKTENFLKKCIELPVGLLIIDSIDELKNCIQLINDMGRGIDVLLRVNPDYVPKGLNQGSATGSRKGCAFGLDLKGEEVQEAFRLIEKEPYIHFRGFHFHIGTGIRAPQDYSNALRCLPMLISQTKTAGLDISVLDVGGGFASVTTRELSTREMLIYQGLGKLPTGYPDDPPPTFSDFTREISQTVQKYFPSNELPELIYEPGRCIVSPNHLLLLTIHRIKDRPGVGKWLIADGGLGTVTLPTFYEYHEIFLCNDVNRPRNEKVSIIGPACFAGDIIYRNKWMPAVQPGEVIAIMDSGAYFIALESSFGFPRPAIISVDKNDVRIIRKRETFEEMVSRDEFPEPKRYQEVRL